MNWTFLKKELWNRFNLNCLLFLEKVFKNVVTWPLYTAAKAAPQAGWVRKCVKMYNIYNVLDIPSVVSQKSMYIPSVIYVYLICHVFVIYAHLIQYLFAIFVYFVVAYLLNTFHPLNITTKHVFAIFVYFVVVYLFNTLHHNQSCLLNPTSTSWRSSSAKATTAFKAW